MEEEQLFPWDVHPDLTQPRLQALSQIFVKVRSDTLKQHDPTAGDGAWSLGCRVYERTCKRIVRLADRLEEEGDSWLTINDKSLRFIFSIGVVPIRFVRSDQNAVPLNPRVASPSSIEREMHCQGELSLGDDENRISIWRLLIIISPTGQVDRVVLANLGARDIYRHRWTIYNADEQLEIEPPETEDQAKDAVDLGAPVVGRRLNQEEEEA